MRRLKLIRQVSGDDGTFGEIIVDSSVFVTGELPDRENKPLKSRIPPGEYVCRIEYSPKFHKNTYLLQGVVGRSAIRIHSANYVGDASLGYRCEVDGCIALGESRGVNADKQQYVKNSRKAVTQFEKLLSKQPFILEIIDETT